MTSAPAHRYRWRLGRAVAGFINIEVVAGHELVGFGRELADFQIQSLGNLVSQLPPAVASPAGRTLAVSADAVDTVSDVTNDAIDRLAQVVNIPVAQSQSQSDHARRCLASSWTASWPGHASSASPSCAQCVNCCNVGGW